MPELLLDLVALGPDDEEVSGDPIVVVLGEGQLPPALEQALEGASVGDVVEVAFGPGEVFGDYDPENIVAVPRDQFDADLELEKGGEVTVSVEPDEGDDAEEEEIDARIVEVDGDVVVLDLNPRLAGKPVTLRAEVLSIEC